MVQYMKQWKKTILSGSKLFKMVQNSSNWFNYFQWLEWIFIVLLIVIVQIVLTLFPAPLFHQITLGRQSSVLTKD